MQRLILILCAVGVVTVVLSLFRSRIGDIRPAFTPSSKDITTIIESKTFELTDFPLRLPEGFQIGIYAKDLPGARALVFSPEGVLLVSQTSKGLVSAIVSQKNGQKTQTVLESLSNPHGMAFYQNKLYVAEEERVVRYEWNSKTNTVKEEKVLFSLPKGRRHFTRSLLFDNEGRLFVSVGSTCDTCRENDERLAAVLLSDKDGTNPHVYASGLRNSVFMALEKSSQAVWATEMGRDFLGDEAPPDEINIIKEGANYGWPLCYGQKKRDQSFEPNRNARDQCVDTIGPVFEIPAHSAPLGLTFIHSAQFPKDWQGDLLVAYHGSWNRSVPTGYKVVRLKIKDNKIVESEDFLTGFLEGSSALGRPVDLVFDKEGNLYLSDDKAGVVYIITKK